MKISLFLFLSSVLFVTETNVNMQSLDPPKIIFTLVTYVLNYSLQFFLNNLRPSTCASGSSVAHFL